MKLKQVMAALVMSLSALTAQAEDTLLPLAPELKALDNLYTVELVLFKQKAPSFNEEVWPTDLPAIDFTGARLPIPNDGMPLSANEELAKSDYGLSDEANRLARQGYEVLYHNAWLQQFNPNTQSTLMLVDPFGSFEGTVRIERQRFLHVYPQVNLYTALGAEQPGSVIRLQESRRMRSQEIHYIDHPVMGMLVLFRPVKDAG
ncbi:MAG TPA: CsiV family protein [Marinobacterium sp.]|nr:CsiV family protein [Marinobacterium sp.]